MANWTVASHSVSILDGASVSADFEFDLVISNIVNGVYTGYDLSADNFKIGNASQGSGSTVLENTWTGGNVDTGIAKVVFSDIGTAGDPANTVNAKVFTGAFDANVNTQELFVDIDERPSPAGPDAVRPRSVYLMAQWERVNVGGAQPQSVTVMDLPGSLLGMGKALSTETSLDTGDSSGTTKYAFSGTVDEGKSTIVSHITFTAQGNHFYKFEPTVSFLNLGEYSNDYNSEVECTRTNGYISSFVVKTYYSPSALASGSTEELEQLGHTMSINYQLAAKTTALTNRITGVGYSRAVSSDAQEGVVRVTGTANTKFKFKLTRSDGSFYSFNAKSFDATPIAYRTLETDSTGIKNVYYSLPRTTGDNQIYTVEIIGDADSGSTLAAGLSEQHYFTKYGTKTLTIIPTTADASLYGDLPGNVTITRPVYYTGSRHSRSKYVSVTATGGTAGASNVNITLEKPNQNIYAGMIASAISGTNIIPHNTTVVRQVREGVIKLSNAVTLAAGTEITFTDGKSDHVPFSFTVVPNAAGDALSVNSDFERDRFKAIGGLAQVNILTNGAPDGKTITLDNVTGLAVGMPVSGSNVSKDSDGQAPVITSIINTTQVTVSVAQDAVQDKTFLTFSSSSLGSSKLEIIDAVVSDSNIVIQGYIRAGRIDTSASLPLHLDNIITVT
jgi:hypothetical protein